MGILDEDVARVRETADLVALVTEQVALRKVGRRYQGLCPFHQEKTPSFSVNPELGLYYCFGCGARGDAISFVRATEEAMYALRKGHSKPAVTAPLDVASQIAKLAELKEKGHLTDEEFQAQKKRLLS